MKLRLRLLLAALVPVLLLAGVLTTAFVLRLNSDLQQALNTRGRALVRQLAATAEFDVLAGRREELAALGNSVFRADPDVRGAALTDADGRLLAISGELHVTRWPSLQSIEAQPLQDDLVIFVEPIQRRVAPLEDIYSGESEKVGAGDTAALPIGHAVIEMSTQSIVAQRNRVIVAGLALALLGAALASLLARRIARSVTRPLLAATEVVHRLGRGELTARMDVDAAGALRALAADINVMAGRIGFSQDQLQQQVLDATRQLRQEKDIALAATVAKSRFIAAAAHDLRQPLHALELFVAALARSSAMASEAHLIASTQASAVTLREMFDAILDLSKLDEGLEEPYLEAFPLEPLFADIVRHYAPLAGQKGLRLKVHGCRVTVRSDRYYVERILFNLVANAVRYTGQGGVLIGCRRRGDVVRVEVWDSGIGIPPAAWQEVFEDYVQLDNPERNREKGLGLGLAICRRLAALLAAPLGLRSHPGRGSVFWLELPLAELAKDGG
ncbi:MAG: hybrid sensor histidine kinase/response regulator [Betaproteobacteria bacterium HGW-Betaproteobacteria-11]|nr:MAG: hybrid sensor histidine kinase/response regulator [Betaproteobacteria bacterium HGW-Betaproteobacteria-11]